MISHKETPVKAAAIVTGTTVFPCETTMWGMFNSIAATLIVNTNAAGVGDTLDVTVLTRANPDAAWQTIITFTQVLGNTTGALLQQLKAINKDADVGWHGEVAVQAVRVGATAAFNITVILEAN